MQATQGLKALLAYIRDFSPQFSLCGTMFPFRRRRGIARCVGSKRADWYTLITWIRAHLIAINSRDNFAAIDLINEIRRPWFNRALGEPRFDTWLHKETPTKIGRAIIVGYWDQGPSKSGNVSRPKSLQRIERAAFFALIYL